MMPPQFLLLETGWKLLFIVTREMVVNTSSGFLVKESPKIKGFSRWFFVWYEFELGLGEVERKLKGT